MINSMSFPDDEQTLDPHADARELAERIDDYMQEGKPSQAKSLFARRWRDLVPELPLRFPVVLVDLDDYAVLRLAADLRSGKPAPELKLYRHGGHYWVRAGRRRRLGRLAVDDAAFLLGLKKDAALYTPHLLEIRLKNTVSPADVAALGPDDDDPAQLVATVAIELVRPELRFCGFCGKRHSEPYLNCAECRAARRRKNENKDGGEVAIVLFDEAIDAIIFGD